MTNRPFWLGVIGCIFGIMLVLCGILLVLTVGVLSGISSSGATGSSTIPYIMITLTGIFSALGLGASLLDTKKMLGGALMIVAAIGISLSFFPFGFIPALFFLLGGILKLLERQKLITSIPQQGIENMNVK